MKFKPVLMPMLLLGIFFTMGSMVYAQSTSTVTCAMTNSATATIGPFAAINPVGGAPGTAIPLTAISTINGVALQGPSGHAAATGHTEVTSAGPTRVPPSAGGGALRVVCYNPGPATNPGVVVLTVPFGIPITNTQTHPTAAAGIRVVNGSGAFVTTTPNCLSGTTGGTNLCGGANVGIGTVNNSGGSIVIGLGTPVAVSSTTTPQSPSAGITFPTGSVSTFDLDGVLLSTNGKAGEVDATLTETSGQVNIGNAVVAVVGVVAAGLVDPVVPSTLPSAVTTSTGLAATQGGPAILNNSGTAGGKANFTIKIAEAFPEMWQSAAQYNGGGVFPASAGSSTQVNVVFKNVPSGLTISGCTAILTDPTGTTVNAGTLGQPSVSQGSVTAASNIITVNFGSAVDQGAADVLWITCTNVAVGSAALPLPSTAVTAQVELGPTGVALSSTSTALTALGTGLIPRFQDVLQPAAGITVITFPPSTTTLLLSLASVGPGYNTGIAIANTSTDPFTPALGGATPIDGTVIFNMYKNDGTVKAYQTTTGSPGVGLTGAGVVKSGSTYLVNLSEILNAAAFGTAFNGYVFITANFTNAHGAATIYVTTDGSAALSTPVLVLPAVSAAVGRATIDVGAGLGQ